MAPDWYGGCFRRPWYWLVVFSWGQFYIVHFICLFSLSLSLLSPCVIWFDDWVLQQDGSVLPIAKTKHHVTCHRRHLTDGFHIVYSTLVTHLPKCRRSWTGARIAKLSVRCQAAIPVTHPRVCGASYEKICWGYVMPKIFLGEPKLRYKETLWTKP